MMQRSLGKRFVVYALCAGMVLATVPRAGALQSVQGTVKGAGAAWVSSDASAWSEISGSRPLVAGDHLRTGDNGYMLADFGRDGIVGLFGNAEVAAQTDGAGSVVGVSRGKVAFHINKDSGMRIAATGAGIAADSDAYGYVVVSDAGKATVKAEHGSLVVSVGAAQRKLAAGQEAVLDAAAAEPIRLAGAYAEPEETKELPAAPPPPPPPAPAPEPAEEPCGLTAPQILGWTALAVVAGVVIYELADDDDDEDASPGE